MPKSKNKVQLPESKLLKAMAELEDAIEKGDELEDQDPEGGLSTEGSPLSNAAPSGKADRTKKSRGGSSSSSSSDDASSVEKAEGDDESSMAKMLSASDASDDDSDDAPPFKKKGKKKSKVSKAAAASSSESDDASSDDESDDDDRPAEKSFRQAAEQDESMAKAIEVSDFLESMVDQIGVHFQRFAKSLTKVFEAELQGVESRLNARIDNRVAKSVGMQQSFNQRLAQAVTAIGTAVENDVVDMIKSLANSPASSPRGKALLSKGEVNQPPWSGGQGRGADMADGSDGDFTAELSGLSPEVIGDWLFKKSSANQVDPKLILAWEADRYNIEALPVSVRKSLVNDLCK